MRDAVAEHEYKATALGSLRYAFDYGILYILGGSVRQKITALDVTPEGDFLAVFRLHLPHIHAGQRVYRLDTVYARGDEGIHDLHDVAVGMLEEISSRCVDGIGESLQPGVMNRSNISGDISGPLLKA